MTINNNTVLNSLLATRTPGETVRVGGIFGGALFPANAAFYAVKRECLALGMERAAAKAVANSVWYALRAMPLMDRQVIIQRLESRETMHALIRDLVGQATPSIAAGDFSRKNAVAR